MKLFLTVLAVCYTAVSFAQATSGTVHYQRIISIGDISMDNVPPEIAALIPKEHKEEKVLYFNAGMSLYENVAEKKKAEETPVSIGDNPGIFMSVSNDAPDEKVFLDLNAKKRIEQKSLMGRTFLINEEIKPLKWKITGKQKKILNYSAMEATVITEGDTITAWFTTAIPVATGPDFINGLPGLVLEASVGKRMAYKATRISADAVAADKIKAPVKGKKVTSEQYAKLAKEKEAEMKRAYGGKGNVIIKTISN